MKKTFFYLALASLALFSCRKEDDEEMVPEVSIETQNNYDDLAAKTFLDTHYFDIKGNVKPLDVKDSIHVKLSALNPITLPSGVVYVMRPDAQPIAGTSIGSNDIIHLMSDTKTYIATTTDSKKVFTAQMLFRNTLNGFGIPEVDPSYYHVKQEVLANNPNQSVQFYEIEGFKEALQKFKAFNLSDDSDYNMQGVIIVPSRAAFGRDPHYNHSNFSLKDRSFVFNFQVYRTTAR